VVRGRWSVASGQWSVASAGAPGVASGSEESGEPGGSWPFGSPCATRALHSCGPECHFLSSLDPELHRVIVAWDGLAAPIRRATLALVDCPN
jgi:hypothetical protein